MLNLVIDIAGTLESAAVRESTGRTEFEEIALRWVLGQRFRSGTLNGRPVASTIPFKVVFELPRQGWHSAAPTFIRAFKRFRVAVSAGNRAAADEAISELVAENLYEDTYLNLARFEYARRWGTTAECMAALRGAIAGKDKAYYLLPAEFVAAARALFAL